MVSEKPKREDQIGEYVCHVHKDKDGEPFFTTSQKEFTEHIMTEHVDAFWKRIRDSEEARQLRLKMNGSKSKKPVQISASSSPSLSAFQTTGETQASQKPETKQ